MLFADVPVADPPLCLVTPELVSGSMACRFLQRSAEREVRPWMLKQVQHDEVGNGRACAGMKRYTDYGFCLRGGDAKEVSRRSVIST
ncbi:hypothetical protein [Sphingopyxis sp. GW247-27LB]|jgi:hypothetical protein|uniref:hypothetical protein n=1 Tax=Sphingopyxis sp. GW247-27LB TaxID=2012632 RepID=UPI001140BC2F|nr:hypothetical protein [Sphingopyxis sp. GW247-27LB]